MAPFLLAASATCSAAGALGSCRTQRFRGQSLRPCDPGQTRRSGPCHALKKEIILNSGLKQLVEVRPSEIAGAGLGLFALEDMKAGTHVTDYRGEAHPPEGPPPGGMITMDMLAEHCLDRARQYSLELGDGRTLVGSTDSSDPSRAGQVVNDAGCITAVGALENGALDALEGYISAIASGRANTRLEVGKGTAAAVAARDVREGEELLTAYSSPWWLAKVGAELQWTARRMASQDDAAGAQASWDLLEEFGMACGMYGPVELDALKAAGLCQGSAELQFMPFAPAPSPELDGEAGMPERLAIAAMQWKATSAPLRRKLIVTYGLEDK